MTVEVKALDTFLHGKFDVKRGDVFKTNKPDAEDLVKVGLVEMLEEKSEPATETKMEAAPKNKMADAPVNKAAKKAD